MHLENNILHKQWAKKENYTKSMQTENPQVQARGKTMIKVLPASPFIVRTFVNCFIMTSLIVHACTLLDSC